MTTTLTPERRRSIGCGSRSTASRTRRRQMRSRNTPKPSWWRMSGSKLLRRRLPVDGNIYRRAVTVFRGSLDQMNAALKGVTSGEFEPMEPSMRGHWRTIEDADGYEADYICILAGL